MFIHTQQHRWLSGLACVALLFAAPVAAERYHSQGQYTIHYNAFRTDILSSDIAKSYRIVRSKNRALLNISVLKKVMGTAGQSTHAEVVATATNLNGQLRTLEMRELSEGQAIYYITETAISNEEVLDYHLEITPEGETAPIVFEFQQQFFTD